jgi:hypothetical protein
MKYIKITLIIMLSLLVIVAGCSKNKAKSDGSAATDIPVTPVIQCSIDSDCTPFFASKGTKLTACDAVVCTNNICGTTSKADCCLINDECVSILTGNDIVIGKCSAPTCSNNMCILRPKVNCCGNNISEPVEDGKKGSKCACPEDWGMCDPRISFQYADGNLGESRYLKRSCNTNNECVVSYVAELQKSNEIFNTMYGAGFSFNIYITYRTPFDKNNSRFDVEVKLIDMDVATMVSPPIIVTELRIMEGSNILTRLTKDLEFKDVDDKSVETLVLNDFSIIYPEELKDVALSIDYEYTPLEQRYTSDGMSVVYVPANKPTRSTYFVSINQIPFLDKTIVR